MSTLFIVLYWAIVAVLSIYGLVGFYLLWQWWQHRHDERPSQPLPSSPPLVTIQLPIYNEPFVVKRLIRAAVQQQYPRRRLQIQVIDDSTDDTAVKAARLVAHYKRKGFNISLVTRNRRAGYKAGALANALKTATGELIAIFDADFLPEPDFLQRTVPFFLANGRVGMVQTRWGHLNADESALTAAQAIALDKHFVVEQTARHRANLFPKFNGAGGIWRRRCIDEAGGWQTDTVCEDLCLSTRAVLQGWQFHFLPDVVTPAELPASILAYKSQQARWAKGAVQCLHKYGRVLASTPKFSVSARLVALLTMAAYLMPLPFLLLLLLQIPLILVDYQPSAWMSLLTFLGLGQPLMFIFGQWLLHGDWLWRLRHLPMLLLLAAGIAPTIVRALAELLYGRDQPFVRTPKRGSTQDSSLLEQIPFDWLIVGEVFLALYALAGIVIAVLQQRLGYLPFLISTFLGLSYVSSLTWQEMRATRPYANKTRASVFTLPR